MAFLTAYHICSPAQFGGYTDRTVLSPVPLGQRYRMTNKYRLQLFESIGIDLKEKSAYCFIRYVHTPTISVLCFRHYATYTAVYYHQMVLHNS